jgi:hypothetical protein
MEFKSEERDGGWVVRVVQQSAIPALGAHVLTEHPDCDLAGEIRAAAAERGLVQLVQDDLDRVARAAAEGLGRRAEHVPEPAFEGMWRRVNVQPLSYGCPVVLPSATQGESILPWGRAPGWWPGGQYQPYRYSGFGAHRYGDEPRRLRDTRLPGEGEQ